jgi:probable HAF family extracellular repeat protein
MKAIQKLAAAIVFGLWFMSPVEAASLYHLTDLGLPPGGLSSHAFDISDAGHVVGAFSAREGHAYGHAFLWTSTGGMQDLGDLPGGEDQSIARRVNDAGQVVGYGFAEDLSNGQVGRRHAFLWTSSSGMQDLGVLPGHTDSEALGINDAGQVIGESHDDRSAGNGRAFLWTTTGGMQTLTGLPNISSRAFGINNAGQVVGDIEPELAYLWSSTDGWQTLGVLPGKPYSIAFAINNTGQVVGYSADGTGNRPFLWTSTDGMQDLGSLGATYNEAFDINDSGQVVGRTHSSPEDMRAFVWAGANGMQDLNTLLDGSGAGWIVDEATAINNSGQIVGRGISPDGQQRAVLLTPVPEPGTFALVATAILASASIASRRNQRDRPNSFNSQKDVL